MAGKVPFHISLTVRTAITTFVHHRSNSLRVVPLYGPEVPRPAEKILDPFICGAETSEKISDHLPPARRDEYLVAAFDGTEGVGDVVHRDDVRAAAQLIRTPHEHRRRNVDHWSNSLRVAPVPSQQVQISYTAHLPGCPNHKSQFGQSGNLSSSITCSCFLSDRQSFVVLLRGQLHTPVLTKNSFMPELHGPKRLPNVTIVDNITTLRIK